LAQQNGFGLAFVLLPLPKNFKTFNYISRSNDLDELLDLKKYGGTIYFPIFKDFILFFSFIYIKIKTQNQKKNLLSNLKIGLIFFNAIVSFPTLKEVLFTFPISIPYEFYVVLLTSFYNCADFLLNNP
jgi:hypothetical protein